MQTVLAISVFETINSYPLALTFIVLVVIFALIGCTAVWKFEQRPGRKAMVLGGIIVLTIFIVASVMVLHVLWPSVVDTLSTLGKKNSPPPMKNQERGKELPNTETMAQKETPPPPPLQTENKAPMRVPERTVEREGTLPPDRFPYENSRVYRGSNYILSQTIQAHGDYVEFRAQLEMYGGAQAHEAPVGSIPEPGTMVPSGAYGRSHTFSQPTLPPWSKLRIPPIAPPMLDLTRPNTRCLEIETNRLVQAKTGNDIIETVCIGMSVVCKDPTEPEYAEMIRTDLYEILGNFCYDERGKFEEILRRRFEVGETPNTSVVRFQIALDEYLKGKWHDWKKDHNVDMGNAWLKIVR